jgi:hypothetical protein
VENLWKNHHHFFINIKNLLLTSYTGTYYNNIMEGRKIVWDPNKAAENLAKHRVSFDTAALVFLDPLRIERRDDSVKKDRKSVV